MRGNTVRRAGIGLLVLTVAASVAGLWTSGFGAASTDDAPPDSFTVPLGHVGDRAGTQWTGRWDYQWIDADGVFEAHEPSSGSSVLWVNATDRVADRAGALHPAISIDHTLDVLNPSSLVSTLSGQEVPCTFRQLNRTVFVGLDTREPLQARYSHGTECDGTMPTEPSLPPSTFTNVYQPTDEAFWLATVLQGRTLRVGERLLDVEARRAVRDSSTETQRALWVEGPKVVEGSWVWVVEGRAVSKTDRPGEVRHTWVNETHVFAAGVAWPISYTYNWSSLTVARDWREWGSEFESVRLTNMHDGSSTIPWGPVDLHEPLPASSERSVTPFPAAGNGFPWPHQPEHAIASVQGDVSLVGLRMWLAQHSDARIAGLRFAPMASSSAAPLYGSSLGATTWSVVFAAPGAETAYRVNNTRWASGVVANSEGRDSILPLRRGERLALQWLPENPVTFAEAGRLWKASTRMYGSAGEPNYFVWGYGGYQDPFYHRWWGPWYFDAAGSLGNVKAGRIAATALENPMARIAGAGSSVAFVNATHGTLTLGLALGYRSPTSLIPAPNEATAPAARIAPGGAMIPAAVLVVPGSLAALALLAYFYPSLKYAAGLVGGYAKLRRSDLLNHPVRQELLQHIRLEPGISPPELHARVGGGWSTIVYHLRVLEKSQLASSILDGRHRRFFPSDTIDASKRAPLAALRNQRSRRLLRTIRDQPGAHQAQLAKVVGAGHAATHWHLERLQRAGLVNSERRGRRVLYFATPMANDVEAPTVGVEFA